MYTLKTEARCTTGIFFLGIKTPDNLLSQVLALSPKLFDSIETLWYKELAATLKKSPIAGPVLLIFNEQHLNVM